MNKKPALITLGLVGLVILAGVGVFVYRNVTNKPAEVVQQTQNIDTQKAVDQAKNQEAEKSGSFQNGDEIHSGSGTASIVESENGPVIVFKDFSVTVGPDLFVYLSPNTDASPLGEFASLGRLKNNSGEQAYSLPADYQKYKSVVIWCRAFNVKFAFANLE